MAKSQKRTENEIISRLATLEERINDQNKHIETLSNDLSSLRQSAANVGAVQTWVRETELRNRALGKKISDQLNFQLETHKQQIWNEVREFLGNQISESGSSEGGVSLAPSANQALLEDLASRCARLLENTRRSLCLCCVV
jgi:archaellum component FlaC